MPEHDNRDAARAAAGGSEAALETDGGLVEARRLRRMVQRKATNAGEGEREPVESDAAADAGETETPQEETATGETDADAVDTDAETQTTEEPKVVSPKRISAQAARGKLRRKIHRAPENGGADQGGDKKEEKIDPTKIDPILAQKILTDSFGSLKTIDAGQVIVLDEAAFIAAWDAIYAPSKAWDPYVKTRYGGLEGFRYGDKQYINKDSHSVSLATVVHEMLHKNAAGDFLRQMGSAINEGVTELLSLEACTKAAFTTGNNSYPGETSVVTALMGAGLDWDTIKTAYFQGGAQAKIAYWIGANCSGTWTEIYQLLEAGDFAAAKTKLRQRT